MPQTRTTAVTVPAQGSRTWNFNLVQATGAAVGHVGSWAVDTAQQFGSLVSVLMAPAILSTYAFAIWCLTANLGWTNSFPYSTGPFSNWFIWSGIAVLVHVAADVLRRHVRS
jgi:hypothetical protein